MDKEDMVGTIARTREVVYCPRCDEDIFKCDECGEYFTEGERIYCNEQGTHLCSTCGE
jgi:hypothetical protein